jgi:hypothetical protein
MMNSSEFLYSPYQSLQLTDLTPVIARMRAQRRGRHTVYAVAPQELARSSTIRSLFATSDMLVGLTALENRYRPYIVGHATSRNFGTVEDWEQYVAAFDPVAMLAWLGWVPEQLLNYAGALLAVAHTVDPNRNVHDLIELWHPAARQRLRGTALLAVDYREAAEVFLRFYEDLVAHGMAAPLPMSPLGAPGPFDGRYRPDMTKRERILTDYGVSTRPLVVLVLEGQTEYEIMMPGTMELLGPPQWRSMIHLENAGTIDRDLSMLAAYVTAPALGEQLGDGVLLLDRTATRFLVAVDPERAYADQAGRERKHSAWVRKICEALPPRCRNHPAIEAQIARLVHIETWGTAAFEYAHFTDEQLAAAINQVLAESGTSGPVASVTPEQVGRWRAANANIEKIVDKQLRLSKVKLAEALWPHLEADLIARRDAGTLDQIPIARVALRAMELAQIALRQRAIDLSLGA